MGIQRIFDSSERILSNFLYYHSQRSCGKVIFSQASVILSTWGGCVWQTPPARADTPRETLLGQTPPGQTPPGRHLPGQTPPLPAATAEDGTHPTGMHSCFYAVFEKIWLKNNRLTPPSGKSWIRHCLEWQLRGLRILSHYIGNFFAVEKCSLRKLLVVKSVVKLSCRRNHGIDGRKKVNPRLRAHPVIWTRDLSHPKRESYS